MASNTSSEWINFQTEMLLQAGGVNAPSAAESSDMTSSNQQKIYVEHKYVDHYNDPIYRPHDGSSKRRGPRGGVLVPFPEKLYQMLNQISEDGLDDVVSWQPHGRCFVVHQPERFVKEVMPRYFSQTKLTSFQRQVNLYGFRRLTTGTDRNGYYHELFLRGRPDLLKRMTRVRVKGIGCKLAPSPATEPNFYRLSTCHKNKMATMLLNEDQSGGASSKMMMGGPSSKMPAKKLGGSNTGSAFGRSTSGFLEAYMASKLEQSRDLAPINHGPNSLFLQVSGRRPVNNESGPLPCTPKSFGNASSNNNIDATPLPAFSSSSASAALNNTNNSLSAAFDLLGDDDLMPLPSAATSAPAGSFLMDNSMQDDIINLLSSSTNVVAPKDTMNSSLGSFTLNLDMEPGQQQPPRVPSSGNILSDMANFWEI